MRGALGDELVGVILGGSAALGAYEEGRSDVDVIAVCAAELDEGRARAVAAAVSHSVLACPARKLELVVMRRGAQAGFELNLNTGEGQEDHVGLDPAAEPAHWFVIDRSIARARGRSLYGPPPREVLADPPPAEVLAALRASLDWHAREAPNDPDTVLNACRAWRWARTGRWSAKRSAAEWAAGRTSEPRVVQEALAARSSGARLDPGAVAAFVEAVRAAVDAVRLG
jgi:aminoglycoside adenylyltransferase-like protein